MEKSCLFGLSCVSEVNVYQCVFVCVCVYACVCVRACVRACVCVCFGFEGGMWDLIILVLDHCLSFYLVKKSHGMNQRNIKPFPNINNISDVTLMMSLRFSTITKLVR